MWVYVVCLMAGFCLGFFISGIMVASKRQSELTRALVEVSRVDLYDYIRDTGTGDQPAA